MVKQIATQPHDGIFLSNKKKNEGMIHITRYSYMLSARHTLDSETKTG